MIARYRISLLVVSLLIGRGDRTCADIYDPPATYYNSATGTGSLLKSQLHNIIDNHTVRSYSNARDSLPDVDRDPNNPNNVILVYNRELVTGSDGSQWNREHTWPKSLGVGSNSGPDGSDIHMLRPSNYQVNSDRGSTDFGGAFGQSYGEKFDKGRIVWYPGDADAGMIARQQFYAAVRYDGSDNGTEDLELANGDPGSPRMGDLARMLEWHYQAPPDAFERRRNDRIYDAYQGNRNPFIDHPEFVHSVFVDQANDTQLTIAGGGSTGSGGTQQLFDFGRVLVGSALPSLSDTVSLNKTGFDGTYYEVTTSGAATSSVGGRMNAFAMGGSDSTTIDFTLNASTATRGVKQGTVMIDNLDVTTSGGSGRGANDGDDVVQLQLSVLDHATPSFAADVELTELTIDLGQVEQGADANFESFSLYNLGDDPSLVARLELDAITSAGDDADRFFQSMSPKTGFEAIATGGSIDGIAAMFTDQVGQFVTSYTFFTSDEDLPGQQSSQLTLTVIGEVIAAALAGDFNGDDIVDGADYTVWRNQFGSPYTQADYALWRDNYGATRGAGAASVGVPEPAAMTQAFLLVTAILVFPAGRRR